MDFLIHTLYGFFLGGLFETKITHVTLILIIASIFPDTDLIYMIFGKLSYFDHHRKITHSFLGIPLFSAILALFFPNFLEAFLLSILAMTVHVLLDLTNHFGTEVFYPFIKKRYALEFTNVVEIPLYFLFAVCIFLLAFFQKQTVSILAMILSIAYLVLKFALRKVALNLASQKFGKSNAWPHFWNIFKWHTIHEEKNKYIFSELNLLKGTLKKIKTFEKAPNYFREYDKKLSEFFDFARYPAIEKERNLIKIQDLRFFSTPHFTMVFKINSDIIADEEFKS